MAHGDPGQGSLRHHRRKIRADPEEVLLQTLVEGPASQAAGGVHDGGVQERDAESGGEVVHLLLGSSPAGLALAGPVEPEGGGGRCDGVDFRRDRDGSEQLPDRGLVREAGTLVEPEGRQGGGADAGGARLGADPEMGVRLPSHLGLPVAERHPRPDPAQVDLDLPDPQGQAHSA